MTKVFIGGSRRVTRLDKNIKTRIDNIINKEFAVLVGDANGADKAIQKYLFDKSYNNVIVFCTGNVCRNNIGNWPTRNIKTAREIKDFSFYIIKDLEMAKAADYGFMIWDAKSKGTLNNILNLIKENKRVLVYYTPEKDFYTIGTYNDLDKLLAKSDVKSLEVFEKVLKVSEILNKEQHFFNSTPQTLS